jgi:hypothetical protein
MRKTIIITCLILSGLIILDSLNAGHALTMLYLAGIVPGTSISLSADNMMMFFALLTGFVVARIMTRLIRPLLTRLPARLRA